MKGSRKINLDFSMKKIEKIRKGIGIVVVFGFVIFIGFSLKKGKGKIELGLSSEFYYNMVIGYQETGENILFGLQRLEENLEKRKQLENNCYQEIEAVVQSVNWKETDQLPNSEEDYCFVTASSFEELGRGISVKFYRESGILQITYTDLVDRVQEDNKKENLLVQTKKKEFLYKKFKEIIENKQKQIEKQILRDENR